MKVMRRLLLKGVIMRKITLLLGFVVAASWGMSSWTADWTQHDDSHTTNAQQQGYQCSICLDGETGITTTTPCCKQTSHVTCLGRWKQQEGTCPNCRFVIDPENTKEGKQRALTRRIHRANLVIAAGVGFTTGVINFPVYHATLLNLCLAVRGGLDLPKHEPISTTIKAGIMYSLMYAGASGIGLLLRIYGKIDPVKSLCAWQQQISS